MRARRRLPGSDRWDIAAVVLAAVPLWVLAASHRAFDYTHAWVSADSAVMARAFITNGVAALGGTPVGNNPPLTSDPDFYVDWPAGYPAVLSVVMRLVGERPQHLHLVMAALLTFVAWLLGDGVARIFGRLPGALAAVAYLLTPIILNYGFGLFGVSLAVALSVSALACWLRWMEHRDRRWLAAAVALGAAATWVSWEPVGMLVGLMAVVLIGPDRRRLWRATLAVGAGMAASIAATMTVYMLHVPWAARQLYEKVLQRSGLGHYAGPAFSPRGLLGTTTGETLAQKLGFGLRLLYEHAELIGGVGLISLLIAAILLVQLRSDRRYARAAYLLVPLAGLWLFWYAVMRQHAAVHEYETMIAAPAAAVAVGIVVAFLGDCAGASADPRVGRAFRWIARGAVPAALAVGAAGSFWQTFTDDTAAPDVAFGRFIGRRVEPGAVVLTPAPSMVPVWYSDRHLVRGVTSDRMIADHWGAFRALCPGCAIYLAVPSGRMSGFSATEAGRQLVAVDGGATLYRLYAPAGAGGQRASLSGP